MMTFQFTKVLL